MRDKIKFHEMTKPMKFRKLKMMKQYTVLWCKALRERIIYLTNYSLYKLNILKRFSYRDNGIEELPLPENFNLCGVVSNVVRGVVQPRLIKESNIEVDYFYHEDKKGNHIRTLTLKDRDESRLFLYNHLEDIKLNIADNWYDVSELPIFKVSVLPPLNAFSEEEPLKELEYKTVTYNVGYLRGLRHKYLLELDFNESLSYGLLRAQYDFCCEEFKRHLDFITLDTLIM